MTFRHSFEFGNPAHIRHLKVGILELGILEFKTLKWGHFDILMLDVLVF